MHELKVTLSLASLALCSCALDDFDALEAEAWVRADENGGITGGFGYAIVPAGSSTDKLQYFVVADADPVFLPVAFDQAGARNTLPPVFVRDTVDSPLLGETLAFATDASSFNSPTNGNVAIGYFDGTEAGLFMLTGENGQPAGRFLLSGGVQPASVAFGDSDAIDNAMMPSSTGIDLFAVSGAELNILPNYQILGDLDRGAPATSCSLGPNSSGLLLADVDTDPAAEGAEVLVSVDGQVFVARASDLQTDADFMMGAGQACFTTPALATIDAPGGEASFGKQMAVGNFDDDAAPDLVIAAPDEGAVYVFLNWSVGGTGVKIATPGEARGFGTTIAVGNFNGDDRDELVVGAPQTGIADHPEAGKVFIFESNASGVFQAPKALHDARAEDNQVFGKSLAVAKGFGLDCLIVGANDEVFTYFTVNGVNDFRQ